jgi:hypothetical protein
VGFSFDLHDDKIYTTSYSGENASWNKNIIFSVYEIWDLAKFEI